jgi:hypothetical protein
MDLSKILSISGRSGLFRVVSQLKNAVLVESLSDKKRFPAFAHDKISSMEEISVFTLGDDLPLKEVLKTIFEKQEGKPVLDAKSDDKKLKELFLQMVPDYDQSRVYVSDIRKIVAWYNILLENNLLDFTEKPEEVKAEEETPSEEVSKNDNPEKEVKEPEQKKVKKTTSAKTTPKKPKATPGKKEEKN